MDTNIRITQNPLCDLSALPASARRCPNRYNRPTLEIRKQQLTKGFGHGASPSNPGLRPLVKGGYDANKA